MGPLRGLLEIRFLRSLCFSASYILVGWNRRNTSFDPFPTWQYLHHESRNERGTVYIRIYERVWGCHNVMICSSTKRYAVALFSPFMPYYGLFYSGDHPCAYYLFVDITPVCTTFTFHDSLWHHNGSWRC